jgi:hypothetical protein
MSIRYTDRIREFCSANGIVVPVGFGRHPASRYAVTELTDPPKLIARTWFNQDDVIYYFEHRAANGEQYRILDFIEQRKLRFNGSKSLTTVSTFSPA